MPKNLLQITNSDTTDLAQKYSIDLLANNLPSTLEYLQTLQTTLAPGDYFTVHALLIFTFLVSLPLLIVFIFKSERK